MGPASGANHTASEHHLTLDKILCSELSYLETWERYMFPSSIYISQFQSNNKLAFAIFNLLASFLQAEADGSNEFNNFQPGSLNTTYRSSRPHWVHSLREWLHVFFNAQELWQKYKVDLAFYGHVHRPSAVKGLLHTCIGSRVKLVLNLERQAAFSYLARIQYPSPHLACGAVRR